MREQQAQLSIRRRASAPVDQRQYTTRVASPHRAGHYAGLHPEDAPYYPTRTRRPPPEDDEAYPGTNGYPVISRNYRKAPMYYDDPQQPPQYDTHPRDMDEKKRPHWFVFLGIVLLVMLVGWVLISLLGKVWQTKMDDWTYGTPRTYQVDQDVGHNGRMSHFIVVNNQGEIEVIETQKGHPDAAKISIVVVLPQDQAGVPATISFQDINGDGKIDALVHIGATEIPLYNNGAEFQSQPPQAK